MRPIDGSRTGPVRHLGAVVIAASLLTGCVQGEGPVVTEEREVRPFSRLEAGSGIQVVVAFGPATTLAVAAQANILSAVATDVAGDTLHIEAADDFSTSEPVTVAVTTPVLNGIDLSGGAQARIDALDGTTLAVSVKGGGRLTASGTVGDVTLLVDGGSEADLADLTATDVEVMMAGGAEATVLASDEVTGTASAGARLTVIGGPSVAVATSGGAEVTTP